MTEESFTCDLTRVAKVDSRSSHFSSRRQSVNILASNVAEQQRRIGGVEPHILPKPTRVVPILQIAIFSAPPPLDADSKQSRDRRFMRLK